MGVYLGKNNLSIYFFRYIEYIDLFLSIYQTYHYIHGDIAIYLCRFAIPIHNAKILEAGLIVLHRREEAKTSTVQMS